MADDKARTERIQRVYRADGYDNLVQEYNDWAGEYDADLKVLGFIGPRAAADMLAKYVTDPDVKILDAGSGTGMVRRRTRPPRLQAHHRPRHVPRYAHDRQREARL